jgi:tetratricopeptide (TPR) repeat protein
VSAISVAQDQAFAALANRRGLLDDTALAQALAAARELAARGEAIPLAQAVVRERLMATGQVTELLRELSEGHYRCKGCKATYSYEALGRLVELRCPPCGGAVDPEPVPPGLSPSQQSYRPGKPVAPSVRRTFGPYELDRELGRGSMGVVYLARRAGFERPFALKVMLTTDVGNAELTARFEREAQLASRLTHPGIIAVIDRGVASGHHYYAMEFCAGETLQSRLRRGPVPLAEAVSIVRELADAVAVAHRAGVVHRDLKPANVIMDSETGRPRITDFGLARDLVASARSLTRTGDLVGTPLYMAPEQVRAEKGVDARADVYALGVILYELLTGTWPFVAATTAELGQLILTGTPRPLRSLAPSAPAAVEAIIAKAMARSRDDRYPGALELRDALDAVRAAPRRAASGGRSRVLRAVVVGILVLAVAPPLIYFAHQRSLARERVEAQRQKDEQRAMEIDGILSVAELRSRAKAADALAVFRNARVKAGNDPRAELAFARFLLRRNQVVDAVGVLTPLVERLRSSKEQGTEARFLLAEAFLRRPGSAGLAREALERVAREDESGLLGKLARARILLLDGRVADARRELEAIVATNGDSALAHKLLARLMTSGYEVRDAMPHYLAELSNRGERDRMDAEAASALAHATRAIEISPDDAEAYVVRSMVRVYLLVFREYGVRRTTDDEGLKKLTDERKRDLDDAILLAEPDPDPLALFLRAYFRHLVGAAPPAILDLEKALTSRPDYPEALTLQAVVKGDDAPFRRAMELDARATWAMVAHLGLLDPSHAALPLNGARNAWALLVRDRIVSLAREQDERVRARILKARPEAQERLREGEELAAKKTPLARARVPLDAAIAAAPGDPWPVLALARLLVGRARPGDALATLDSLPKTAEPDEVEAIRGEALLRAGRFEEAKASFDRLAARSSGQRKLLAEAGAFRAIGDITGARARAEEAVRTEPSDPEGHRVLAEALSMGPAVEPEAAHAEAELALALEGVRDADNLFYALLGGFLDVLATPAVMRPETTAGLEESVNDGWALLDAFAPCARYRLILGERLMAVPAAAGLRALGRKETEAALANEPGSAPVAVVAGRVFLAGDDVDAAVRAWRAARTLDPGVKLPADGLARMKALAPERAKEFERP